MKYINLFEEYAEYETEKIKIIKNFFEKYFNTEVKIKIGGNVFLKDQDLSQKSIPIYSISILNLDKNRDQILSMLDDVKKKLKFELNLIYWKVNPYWKIGQIDIWLINFKYGQYLLSNRDKIGQCDVEPGFHLYGRDIISKKFSSFGL